MDWTS